MMMSNRETTDDGCSVVYILYMSIMHQHRTMSDRSGDGEGAGDLRRRRAAGSGGWQRGWPLDEVGRVAPGGGRHRENRPSKPTKPAKPLLVRATSPR